MGVFPLCSWTSGVGAEIALAVLLRDIHPGKSDDWPRSSYPDSFTVIGDNLFFAAQEEEDSTRVWVADSDLQIYALEDLMIEHTTDSYYYSAVTFHELSSTELIIFTANWIFAYDRELNETRPRYFGHDLEPNDYQSFDYGDWFYFQASNTETGCELLALRQDSDGLVTTALPIDDLQYPQTFVVFQDLLFFVAFDDISANSQSLYYINDATHNNTAERIDLNFTALNTAPVVVNDKLFLLSTKEDTSLELHVLDSNLTLTLVQDFVESDYVTAMTALGDSVVFGLMGSLWVSDGVTATLLLETFDYFRTDPSMATVFKDKLYILSFANVFVTNGTAAGTGPLLNALVTDTRNLVVVEDKLCFFALTISESGVPSDSYDLWCGDGTPEGTAIVSVSWPNNRALLPSNVFLTAFDGKLVFSASDDEVGQEPWAIVFGVSAAWQAGLAFSAVLLLGLHFVLW